MKGKITKDRWGQIWEQTGPEGQGWDKIPQKDLLAHAARIEGLIHILDITVVGPWHQLMKENPQVQEARGNGAQGMMEAVALTRSHENLRKQMQDIYTTIVRIIAKRREGDAG